MSGGFRLPGRRFRCRLPLPIDHADLEWRLENGLGHVADGECLAGAGSSHDPKPPTRTCEAANVLAVLTFQQGLEVQAQRQFYGFAGSTRRSDDDDASSRRLGCEKCLRIGGKKVITGNAHTRT